MLAVRVDLMNQNDLKLWPERYPVRLSYKTLVCYRLLPYLSLSLPEAIFHVNEPITALNVFPSGDGQRDHVVIGTEKSLLMFDVSPRSTRLKYFLEGLRQQNRFSQGHARGNQYHRCKILQVIFYTLFHLTDWSN